MGCRRRAKGQKAGYVASQLTSASVAWALPHQTRGSWRAGMTDRAAFLRRLPDAPERRPGGEQPNRGSVSFVG